MKKSEIPFGAQFSPSQVNLPRLSQIIHDDAGDRTGITEVIDSELPLSQILANLKLPDKHVRGKALERLGIYFTRLIDLDFKGWLMRSVDSNGGEIEIVANDRSVPFNRWQIQCRNVSQTGMGDIATAVGRGISFKPNVLLSLTTGHFTQQARYYATKAMQFTNLQILLVDAPDLSTIASNSKAIKGILNRETEQARNAKEPQIAPLYA